MRRVRHTVADVMTPQVATVDPATPFKRIVELLVEHDVSALPVVAPDGQVLGIVSEADLLPKEEYPEGRRGASLLERLLHPADLDKAEAAVACELMTPAPVTITPGASLADAARQMLAKSVKRLPVVDGAGRLVGIVSRSDVLGLFLRPDGEIRDEIREAVIARELTMDPLDLEVGVRDGVVLLAGQVERRSQIPLVRDLVRTVEGVVRLDARLSYAIDDTIDRRSGIPHARL
jgi:CBS domain-containing protein